MSVTNRVLGLMLLTWAPLVVLAGLAGGGMVGPLFSDYVVHVRFLVALPVLAGAEGLVWRQVNELAEYFVQSGIVAGPARQTVERLVALFHQIRRSWAIPVVAALGAVILLVFVRGDFSGNVSAWQFVPGLPEGARTAAGWWYRLVSIPVFRFFMLLWALRYLAWCWFLYRLSRLDLVLVPIHPDRLAGLRPIGQVHQFWAVIVFAVSAVVSAHVGLELRHGRPLGEVRVETLAFVGLSLVVLFAPLLAFASKLLRARQRGLLDYGALGAEYTRQFDARWNGRLPAGPELLGSADIQSLADLANSYDVVRQMSMVPFGVVNVLAMVIAILLPFAPLVFTVVSPSDVFKALVRVLL